MNSSDDIYEILYQIGRGSYASVHKAINRQTGEICAIKKLPLVTSEFDSLKNEISILSGCECENIVRFLGSASSGREVSIIMEYCSGGSVKDLMRRSGRTLNQEQITVIVKDVLNGLDYLHSKSKIHRDVKAANILLNDQGIAKLSDFGVSEPLDTAARKQSMIGTLLWLPPEVIKQDLNYSSVIDIWSLGITIIEMGDGQPPYNELGQDAALKEIANMTKMAPTFKEPNNWSPIFLDFLSLCLNKDAKKRKTASELLTHGIIKTSSSNEVIQKLLAEICSNTFTSKEPETNLFRKCECLLKESRILFSIYRDHQMKVIKVDQMTHLLKSVCRDFDDLQEKLSCENSKIDKMLNQSRLTTEEILRLERERNDLETKFKIGRERKKDIIEQLEVIRRKKHEEFNNSESMRRRKLSLLESR